jgi:hypothetical protein
MDTCTSLVVLERQTTSATLGKKKLKSSQMFLQNLLPFVGIRCIIST